MNKILMLMFGIILTLPGCGTFRQYVYHDSTPAIVIDSIDVENYFEMGVNREYFYQIPSRVFVIGANEIETLLDLGVNPSVITAADHQDNPIWGIKQNNRRSFDSLSFITAGEVNKEHVLYLQPDLIIAQQEFFSKNRLGSTHFWNQKGIYTLVPFNTTAPGKTDVPETVDREMQFIHDMGLVFQKEDQAQKIINDTYNRIHFIAEKRKGKPGPKVMILDLISITAAYGPGKIAGNLAQAIGGNVPDTPAAVGDENIIQENPDVVFLVTYGDASERLKRIEDNKSFRNLNFIKNRRLYPIPLKYVYGPETRTIDAVGYMAERMYPGEFSFPKEYNAHF